MTRDISDVKPATSTADRGPASGGFRGDLEGLRAVAVVLVVAYHAQLLGLVGGYVGVDVFYVLSGFFITGLLVREFRRTARLDLVAFYVRRGRRLLPVAAVVLVVVAVAGYLILPFVQWTSLGWDIVAAGLNVANFRFAAQSTDYLAQGVDQSAVLHFWSLGVEEQFYLFWPLLVLGLMALGRKGAKPGGEGRRTTTVLVVGIGTIAVLSLLASVILTATAQSWAFFMLPTRAWELAVGALIAVLAPALGQIPHAARRLLAVVGVVGIVVAAVVFDDSTPTPGIAMLLPVVATAAVIVGGDARGVGAGAVLRWAPLRWIGRWSYSIYLWHWPLLVFPAAILGAHIGELSVPLRVGLCLASIVAGILSYVCVERVFRTPKASPGLSPRRGARVGLAIAAACVVVAVVPGVALIAVTGTKAGAPVTASTQAPADGDDAARHLREGLALSSLPASLTPSLAAAADALPATYANGCHLEFAHTEFGECVFGDQGARRTAVLVGDSHAAQWFPALDRVAAENGWRLVSLTKSACAPTTARLPHPSDSGRDYTECAEAHRSVVSRVAELRPQLVLASAMVSHKLSGAASTAWFSGVTDFLGQLSDAGAEQIVVLGDTPRPAADVPSCVAKNVDALRKCNASADTASPAGLTDRMAAAAESARARFVATTDWMCIDGGCPVVVGNTLMYRDESHITPEAAVWSSAHLAGLLTPPSG
ncbi:acyltransferase [Leifsonia shinshuensis]|uniref:acyltransferase family protein n=1 Tax=Leifsonia shinshuensis TaxID=150026 RepID=UPI001F510A44|nr:acyltransferase family protein [Leifsonia shinshuensis]MCI0156310.1 acyltransferase [Leifsonia shinshuensis]